MKQKTELILLCGKMGAGKTTLSIKKSQELNAVLISEDEWLSKLYPNKIKTFEDYILHANLLKPLVVAHVRNILNTGTSVVMDFPANTIQQRFELKCITTETTAHAKLLYLTVDDAQCLKQIAQRRLEQPERADFDTEEVFHHVTQFFQIPTDEEGLLIEHTS